MSAESVVRAKLLANGPVAALIGTRMYPVLLPQAPITPAIVYQRVTGDHPVDQDGWNGPNMVRLQLDLWATTYDVSVDLRDKVLTALNGSTAAGLQGAFSESEQDMYDDAVKLHRVSMDFLAYEA